jgi:hypothetical protein
MASTLENALRLVKPGEMVVSVTDILDKLGNKITAEDRQQLLVALLSPRREKVQPGDLITTDLVNQILVDLAELQIRVGKIETGVVVKKSPEILGFIQSPPFYPLQQIDMQGRNFSVPPENNKLTIDGNPVTQFSSGSTSQLLTFTIPSSLSVDTTERQVSLQIENADHLAVAVPIRVKERVVPPNGGLEVLYKGGPISTLVAESGSYELEYKVTPTTRPEQLPYRLETTSVWKTEVFDEVSSTWVTKLSKSLASATPYLVRVRVSVPSTANTGDRNDVVLRIVQTTLGTQIGNGTSLTPLEVGQPVPSASDTVGISIKSLPQGTSIKDGLLLIDKPASGVTPGTLVTFLVTFSNKAEAGTYALSSKPNSSRWNLLTQTAVNRPANVPASTEVDVDISADKADAPNTEIIFVLSKTLADGSSFAATHVLAIGIAKA